MCSLIRWKQEEVPGSAEQSLPVSRSVLGAVRLEKNLPYIYVFPILQKHVVLPLLNDVINF